MSAAVEPYVVTFVQGAVTFYRNGRRLERQERTGDFSNWNPDFALVLGNEITGERDWLGETYLVAIYDRALDELEVRRNFEAGGDRLLLSPGNEITLAGAARDDGLPNDSLSVEWRMVSGPAEVEIVDRGRA